MQINKISLSPTAVGKLHIFGFYFSEEGRNFLRDVYSRLVKRLGGPVRGGKGSHWKVANSVHASLMADVDAQVAVLADEVSVQNVRSALERWHNGQHELWVGKPARTMGFAKHLEALLMAYNELSELLEDCARSVVSDQIGDSFSRFFGGTNPPNATGSLNGHFFEMLQEPGNEDFWFSSGYLHSYWPHPSGRYSLAREFQFVAWTVNGHVAKANYTHRYDGFAFPQDEKTTFRLLASKENPAVRAIDRIVETGVGYGIRGEGVIYSIERRYVPIKNSSTLRILSTSRDVLINKNLPDFNGLQEYLDSPWEMLL